MSERRQHETRYRKRLAVRFWKRGEDKVRSGFTTNISAGGMFIGSNQVLARGTRLRIEVMDPKNGFMVEGVVARSERSRPELRSVRSSGMGVRFLPVSELVSELFPKAERLQAELSDYEQEVAPQPAAAPTPAPREVPAPTNSPAADGSVAEQQPEAPEATQQTPPTSTRPARQMRGFAIRYATLDDLRRTYERDIVKGGLFVSTPDPADRGDVVMIEIRPPAEAGSPFRLRARVVHTFERGTQGGMNEDNLLAGMGVEWLDPEAARKSFEYYLGDVSSESA